MAAGWIQLLFFLSGLAGLVYEVSWVRLFRLALGGEVHAVSAVVSAFFLGLALGSWLLGRAADRVRRPLRLCGLLEIAIAAAALLVPAALGAVSSLVEPVLAAHPGIGLAGGAMRFVPAFLVLVIPTALMGGTLPLLARALAARPRGVGKATVAEGTGILYAGNTLGAAAGAFLGGFVLLGSLGLGATTRLAAALNLALGLAFLLLREPAAGPPPRRRPARPARPAPGAPAGSRGGSFALLAAAFGVSGFAAMAYQLLWTRAFLQIFQNSVYSFAAILTSYLLGIGGGSLWVSLRAARIRRPAFWFGAAQAGVALGALASLFLLRRHFDEAAVVPFGPPPTAGCMAVPLEEFLFALGVTLVPTLLMGAAFPLLVKAAVEGSRRVAVGGGVGFLLAANTAGGVLGPLAAAYLLLPLLETRGALLATALAHAGAGILVLLAAPRRPRLPLRAAAALGLGGAAALLAWSAPPTLRHWRSPGAQEQLVAYREGPDAAVCVVRDPGGGLRMKWNNSYSLGGTEGLLVEQRQGHLPALLHPDPRRALLIGLGTGDTAGALAAHPGLTIDCLEIMPGVIEMARLFRATNGAVLDNPRVRILGADGRTWLRWSGGRYDLVIADLFLPRRRGAGAMYTREAFFAARERLAPGGLFVQWLPLYLLDRDDLAVVARTFLEAFPRATLWLGYLQSLNPIAALVGGGRGGGGGGGDPRIPMDRMRARFEDPGTARVLDEAGFSDPMEVLALFVCGPERLRGVFGEAPVATDDLPLVEFRAPRNVRPPLEQGLRNLRFLATLREPPGVEGVPAGDLASLFRAAGHLLRGHLELLGQTIRPVVLPGDLAALRERVIGEFLAALEAAPPPAGAFSSAVMAVNAFYHELAGRGDPAALEEASRLIEGGAPLRPGSFVLQLDLGECRLREGRFRKAIPPLERAASLRGDRVEPLVRLGVAYQRAGRPEDSLRVLERARTLPGAGAPVYKMLGILYLQGGRLQEALEALDLARRFDPEDGEIEAARQEAARRLEAGRR